ncbi:small secreted protein [Stachybotrys elegans]|uniref:Small secreted protein n=1 Tax=Stachybotrys elegans TaxID=80388 RepID=A0A8K0T1J7_9HYPO|nr:small secreted protein [Stachybotrys elegans]
MKFSLITVALATLAAAVPVTKRAVFSNQSFAQLSISGGVAGNAQAEALQKLSGLPQDLTTVDKADLDFLSNVNSLANDVEKGAFNPAIEAASGEEADALQRGKIKNKVLKLTATILALQVKEAQGQDVSEKMATELKKLQNNIQQDEEAAGLPSTDVQFNGDTDSA